jgi:glycosyltransferase involved in cell wall biosynthesis
MRFVRTGLTLVMMPMGLTPDSRAALSRRIDEWDLGSRVEVIPDASPQQRQERLRHSLGCLSVGLDQEAPEDAVIEAFHACRPVLTVSDSGAPNWMIDHGVNGVKPEPNPRLLAVAMNRLADEPSYRRELGEGAFRSLAWHRISWDHVAESLLA